MKVIRDFRKMMLMAVLSRIDEESGDFGGGADSISSTLQSAFAGDTVDPEFIPDPEKPIEKGEGGGGSGTQQDNQEGDDKSPSDMWMWKELEQRTSGTDWKIPEEITTGKKSDGTELSQAERFEMFVSTVNQLQKEEDDDFISSYRLAKKEEGFDINKFIQAENEKTAILSADDDTFLHAYLRSQKNAEGKQKHSDDDIKEYVSKMNSIEKTEKANQLREQLKSNQKSLLSQREAALKQKEIERFNAWEADRQTMVSETITKVGALKDIAGIPITESDIAEFQPIFDKLTQYNPKTQQLFMDDYLQSNNENVFKMLYLLHKSDKGEVEKHIASVKESIKDNILKKTGVKPNIQGGTGASGGEKAPESKQFF